MKTEKEIIDEIVRHLKSQPEIQYRQGAWEGFNRRYMGVKSKSRQLPQWAAAAATFLLLGIGALYYINDTRQSADVSKSDAVLGSKSTVTKDFTPQGGPSGDKVFESKPSTESHYKQNIRISEFQIDSRPVLTQSRSISEHLDLPVVASLPNSIQIGTAINSNDVVKRNEVTRKYSSIGTEATNIGTSSTEQLAMAASAMFNSEVSAREVENISQDKQMRFGEKFDLGLYVSPHSTGDKMKVGGGLSLAYNLSSKVSLRTGASYNSYEVGTLKNPNSPSSYESVIVSNDMDKNMLSSPSTQTSRMIIPNVNAITSIVQSVDIPIELKYNVGKTLYAVAGVSYSAIVGQARNAHYVDNVNTETFSQGFPENEKQMKTAVKAVTKTVKSADNSVGTNGFNGFVNFSVGKKVKVNNRFGVSVEPYFKIPVGEYRRADMDYTNGGIRIMTNF